MGQFISAGVLAGLVNYPGALSYKIPFALQWIWPLPLATLAYFAPESPWYLVRTGQLDEAKKSLQRLSEPSHNIDYDAAVAMMVHTDKTEKEEQAGTTYAECFKGTNLRRTEIACMSFLSQITNGGALCYSGSFFFQQIGLPDDTSYYIGLGGTAVAFCGTIISWLYIYRWGRRTIWLVGFSVITAILWIIGILGSVPQTRSIEWAQALLCIVWLGAYSMSFGPIVYTIVAEIGSTRLRTQTVVLARSTYYVGNLAFGGAIQPELISPGSANLKGKTAFFWAALATPTLIWGYFRQFETKDRTFGEMEYMVSFPSAHNPRDISADMTDSSSRASPVASRPSTSSTRTTSSSCSSRTTTPTSPRSSPELVGGGISVLLGVFSSDRGYLHEDRAGRGAGQCTGVSDGRWRLVL